MCVQAIYFFKKKKDVYIGCFVLPHIADYIEIFCVKCGISLVIMARAGK